MTIHHDIQVDEVSCFPLWLVPEHPHILSGGRRHDSFETVVVRVTSTDGTVGLGEASTMGGAYLDGFPAGTIEAIRQLAPAVLSTDAMSGRAVLQAMDQTLVGQRPAKAALDTALLDLRARTVGVPAAVLLGGARQPSVDAFMAVSIGPEASAVEEARSLCSAGYRRIQIKVGDDPLVDAARVRSIVDAVATQIDYLSCDANRAWSAASALRFSNALDGIDAYLEQPCAGLAEIARLRTRCHLQLILDEGCRTPAELLEALALNCVDAVNIKPVRVGGLTRAATMRDVAESARLMMLVDEPMGGAIASAGIAALASTIDPGLLIAASFFGDLVYQSKNGPMPVEGGASRDGARITASPDPGLGVTIDADRLGQPTFRFRRRDIHDA